MDYNIKYSDRKTIAIHILKDGSVEVRCPFGTNKSTISEFVTAKNDWIQKHSIPKKELYEQKNSFNLAFGASLTFLGNIYPLISTDTDRYGFNGTEFYAPNYLDSACLKDCMQKVYKRLAEKLIVQKTANIARQLHANYSGIKINSASTRWGSCSGKNSLNFSWKLIIADERAVDYVIVHELAHTFEHNHGPRFWAIVERVFPDYKERQQLLRDAQKIITVQGW